MSRSNGNKDRRDSFSRISEGESIVSLTTVSFNIQMATNFKNAGANRQITVATIRLNDYLQATQ